jgi:hypothetical protein
MSFDWKATLKSVAPALATALGGPMAGMAATVAVKALGGEPSGNTQTDLQAVSAAVASGDPSVFVKLREAEQNYLLEMERLGLEHENVHAADRASARDLAKSTGTEPQIALSGVYTVGYFALLLVLFSGDVDIGAEYRDITAILLGVMTKAQSDIMQFWFGSSAGSKRKDLK